MVLVGNSGPGVHTVPLADGHGKGVGPVGGDGWL